MQVPNPPITTPTASTRCYICGPFVEIDLDPFLRPNLVDCCWQRACAELLSLLAEGDPASIATFHLAFDALWGPDYQLQITDGPGFQGKLAYIQGPTYAVVFVVGTQTWVELWREIWHGFEASRNFGRWSTSTHWFNRATELGDTLEDLGWNPDKPVTFVGHSQGDAISYILARRMLDFDDDRDVQLLTYGCPKIGDVRLTHDNEIMPARHLINDGDPVPLVPPDPLPRSSYSRC